MVSGEAAPLTLIDCNLLQLSQPVCVRGAVSKSGRWVIGCFQISGYPSHHEGSPMGSPGEDYNQRLKPDIELARWENISFINSKKDI